MLTKPLCTNGIRLKEIKASSVGTISRKKQHNLAKHERKTSQRNSNSLLMICICVCLCHCDFYSLWNLLNTHIQPVLTIISVIIITADGITTIYTFQLFFSPSLHRSFISHITFLACKHTHTTNTNHSLAYDYRFCFSMYILLYIFFFLPQFIHFHLYIFPFKYSAFYCVGGVCAIFGVSHAHSLCVLRKIMMEITKISYSFGERERKYIPCFFSTL